jgi:hypothetical protein
MMIELFSSGMKAGKRTMTVSVKGRNIRIRDSLAEEYKKKFFAPVDGEILLAYFSVENRDILEHMTDRQLEELAERHMRMDLSIWG